jgi:hypothetical protein
LGEFVVEGKMIVVGSFKCSPFPLKRGADFIRSSEMAKKAQPKCPVWLLPTLPVDELAWQILPDKFSA